MEAVSMKGIRLVLVLLLGMGLTLSCSNRNGEMESVEQAPAIISIPDKIDTIDSINTFTLDFLKQQATGPDSDGNVILSPQSIFHGMAMSYVASGGVTRQELADTFYFSSDQQRLLNSLALIRNRLMSSNKSNVSMANSLWMDNEYYTINPEYVSEVEESFDASLYNVEFDKAEQAAHEINQWVSQQTRGHIKKSVEPEDFVLTGLDKVILVSVNAIYFKSDWETTFSNRETSLKPFYNVNKTTNILMMHQNTPLRYAENKTLRFLEIPYVDGDFSMHIFLPHKDIPIHKLMDMVELPEIEKLQESATKHQVDLLLPKFKVRTKIPAEEALKEMGVKTAFERGETDFDRMIIKRTPGDFVYLSKVHHDAWIEVNEEGSEAAAATSVIHGGGRGAPPPPPPKPIKFHADHPFLFTIHHNRTDTILFAGWISDPKKLDQK